MNKIKSYFVAHKIISSIVLLIIILGGYWGYKKITNTSGDNRYVTAEVQKGTVIVSVSGSGQVSSSNQVDIKAKVSGDVSYIGAISGQKIGTGGTIVELATKDADKAVRDAEVNLESAQLVLDKIKKPADDLSITESQDTLDKANQSKQNAQNDLKNAHSNGFNVVTNAYLDLPNIMTGLNDMFFKSSAGTQQQWNIDWYQGQVASGDNDQTVILKQKFIDSYNKAKASFDINTNNFKITSTASDDATIETLISQTYDSVKLISDAIKNAGNYLDFVNSSILKNTEAVTPAILTTHKAILNTDTSKVNTALTNLSSASTTIENSKQAITNADQTITENTQSLSKLQAGADVLDIQSAELSVKQKANTLQDAKDNLADYFIRAPFSGTVAVVNTKKSDSVSAGTVVATLITNSQLA
jgi:HlyD family secretion protein